MNEWKAEGGHDKHTHIRSRTHAQNLQSNLAYFLQTQIQNKPIPDIWYISRPSSSLAFEAKDSKQSFISPIKIKEVVTSEVEMEMGRRARVKQNENILYSMQRLKRLHKIQTRAMSGIMFCRSKHTYGKKKVRNSNGQKFPFILMRRACLPRPQTPTRNRKRGRQRGRRY